MKKTLQISTLLLAALFYGQSISDFQYILVPQKFKNEKANNYDLNILLASKLKAKKFVIFNETFEDRPAESNNPCAILKAEVSDASNMFTNKVRIDFKDCNYKTVGTLEGKSNIKEFEEGMRAALVNSLTKLSPSNPSTQETVILKNTEPVIAEKTESIKEIEIQEPTSKIVENTTNSSANRKAEVYSNGNLTLNKIILGNGEFILVNPNNSIPYASFKPSTKKDVFRVQLQNGTSTLGYLEEGKILIEIPNADGSFRNEAFLKK